MNALPAANKKHGYLPVSSLCFSQADIEHLSSPCVYAFLRGDEVLYVGKGVNGIERPISTGHHKANVRKEADRILIYFFKSRKAAEDAETTLIEHFSPKYNDKKKARGAVSTEEQRENFASIKKARLIFVKILGHSGIPVSHSKLLNWQPFWGWNTGRKDYGEDVLLAALEAWLVANKLWLQGKEVRNGRRDGHRRGLGFFLRQFLENAKQKAAA